MGNDERVPDAQAALFMEHARWVMDWHSKRAEGVASRSVAILGFSGVTLALLMQGAGLRGLDPTAWTWRFASIGVGALLLASLFALLAISTKKVRMHDVQQLRSWWGEYVGTPRQDFGPDLVETLLLSSGLTEDAPISTAQREADQRVKWFKLSVWLLGVALVDLGALGLNILNLTRGSK